MMDFLMHLDTNQPLVLLLNAALCLTIIGICICRLNAMDKGVLFRVQFEYVFYMACGTVSICRPWWGENVGWASLLLESGIIVGFLSSSHAWRPKRTPAGMVDTPPDNARTDHAPLELTR